MTNPTKAASFSRLHHVGIVVEDLASSAAWYCEHLGFAHQYDFTLPGAKAALLVHGYARIELFEVEHAIPLAPERRDVGTTLKAIGINHLALVVDDLEATVANLRDRGVTIAIEPTAVPNESGDRFAFIRDVEGMLVELFQPVG